MLDKRKLKLLSLTSLAIVAIPSGIVSCSKSSFSQDEANQFYLDIYRSFSNKKNNYLKPEVIAYNVFDNNSLMATFDESKMDNPFMKLKNSNAFTFRISNIKQNAIDGNVVFKFDLVDKKTNKVINPTLKIEDDGSNFYSQTIEISGFKKIDKLIDDEVKNIFENLNQTKIELNQTGKDWVNMHSNSGIDNLLDNISFIDPNKKNYFTNYINIPDIKSNNFRLSKYILTNELNQKSIEFLPNKKVRFNFWFLLETNNSSLPLTINISYFSSSNETLYNEIKIVDHILG